MCLSIIFAFVSVCTKFQFTRLADGQSSRIISHRIVALAFISGWCDRIVSDILAFSSAQRIADCIVVQCSIYLCREFWISCSIRLTLAVGCYSHRLRRYLQRYTCRYCLVICILGFHFDCLLANILDARSFRRPITISYLVGNRCACRNTCTCGCSVCLSIIFAFVSVCTKFQFTRLADCQGSRNITYRIVALVCCPGWRNRVRSNSFAFSTAQLIAYCVLTQRAVYCCRQLRIRCSIFLALVLRYDSYYLRINCQRSIYSLYRELICNICISLLNNNGVLV